MAVLTNQSRPDGAGQHGAVLGWPSWAAPGHAPYREAYSRWIGIQRSTTLTLAMTKNRRRGRVYARGEGWAHHWKLGDKGGNAGVVQRRVEALLG
jgi:hypothetical protein